MSGRDSRQLSPHDRKWDPMKTLIFVVVLFGAACAVTFAESPQAVESKLDALMAKIESLEKEVLALKTQMRDLSQQEIHDRGQVSVINMQMQDMSQRVINDEGQIRAVTMQMGLARPSMQQQVRQAEYDREDMIQQAINDPGRY